jgi:hypothetical protein
MVTSAVRTAAVTDNNLDFIFSSLIKKATDFFVSGLGRCNDAKTPFKSPASRAMSGMKLMSEIRPGRSLKKFQVFRLVFNQNKNHN